MSLGSFGSLGLGLLGLQFGLRVLAAGLMALCSGIGCADPVRILEPKHIQ